MGWGESRIMLFPPRWRPRTEMAKHGRTANGPVQLMDCQREETVLAGAVDPETVAAWLHERGFDKRQKLAKVATLGREDIEVDLFTRDGELSHAVVTFTLSKESPDRWDAWREFVDEICAAWNLALADTDCDRKVGTSELFHILAQTPSWQDFQRTFAWPAAIHTEG